jgi:di/tricarboxylate transporter
MNTEMVFVFALIGVAAVLMASNRVRFDIVALLVVLALMLSGILSVGEALAGFGSSVVILVAGLLVIGEMLARTGVARAVGDWILQRGGTSETRLLVLIMLGAGLLGSIMSSTAVVAIFIPIVLRIAAETKLSSSRLLMPMSYAALISGMLTLIATTPNIVVHEELKEAGFNGFGFFGFTVIGAAILVVAVVYMLLIGRRLLTAEAGDPESSIARRSIFEIWKEFRTDEDYQRLRIDRQSPLAGVMLAEADLEGRYELRVLGVVRDGSGDVQMTAVSQAIQLVEGDTLAVVGRPEELERFCAEQVLRPQERSEQEQKRWLWDIGGSVALLHPDSGLIGKSLRDAEFRSNYGIDVLGLRRAGEAVTDYADTTLQASDSLFLVGPWSSIRQLQTLAHDFVVLEVPAELENVVPSYRRMPVALAILVGMVLLTVFDLVPLVAAVILAVLAAVFTRCLTMEDAYRSIHWSSLVLVAGMLPLADALDVTGGTQLIVDTLLGAAGGAGPYVMLSIIFFLTASLSLVLSNTASAVLVAPIAIYAAAALDVSPYPFAVAVLIAASSAFSTPVSTPVVTLVVDPGRYRFIDFVKVGVPMLMLSYLVTLLVAPLVFPFSAA